MVTDDSDEFVNGLLRARVVILRTVDVGFNYVVNYLLHLQLHCLHLRTQIFPCFCLELAAFFRQQLCLL